MTKNVPRWLQDGGESSESLPKNALLSSENLLLAGTLIGLGISGTHYAMWLNSPLGRKWDQQHTWFVTVIGVLMTLAWLALHDWKAALKAFTFFAISGTPIVVRALNNESAVLEAYITQEKI